MRQRTLARPGRQPDLFHAPANLPQWTALPLPARQAVLPLLVELLKVAALPAAHDAVAEQDSDDE